MRVQDFGSKLLEQSAVIIGILTENLSRRSDRDLRLFRRRTSEFAKKEVPSTITTVTGAQHFYLDLIREEFSSNDWDQIVRATDRLEQAYDSAASDEAE